MEYIIIVGLAILLAIGAGTYLSKKNKKRIRLLIEAFIETLDEDLDEKDIDAVIRHLLEKLLRAPDNTENLEKEVTAKVLEIRSKEEQEA